MESITGTHIAYLQLCHRKLWLFANGLQMEHSSDLVLEGKLVHESSYGQRAKRFREVDLGNVRIDFYDPKMNVVHEVKRGKAVEVMHVWQLKYYLWVMELAGFEGVTGVLEYPRLRERKVVCLEDGDRERLKGMVREIEGIVGGVVCPERVRLKACGRCAYFDLCWVNE
ncbi:MAG: CRISPR-associated protein Cas4 [Chitinophagales bacterium]